MRNEQISNVCFFFLLRTGVDIDRRPAERREGRGDTGVITEIGDEVEIEKCLRRKTSNRVFVSFRIDWTRDERSFSSGQRSAPLFRPDVSNSRAVGSPWR